MRINYTYQYQDFPGAPGLTGISKFIGKLTASPLWYFFVSVIMSGLVDKLWPYLGMESDFLIFVSFVLGFVLVYFIHKFIRTKCGELLQKKYIAKVNALKDTNPAKYYEIMMELQKRQSGR